MKTVAIAGVGLIGGSFGLALRDAGFAGKILGVSSSASIDAGIRAGAIDRGATLDEVAERADLIYLSQPIEQILTTLDALGPIARAGCLITDAGSTKQAIVERALDRIKHASFIGGHPMAGKEQRGAEAGEATLFRDRPYVLTPVPGWINSPVAQEFRHWLERIGARVLEMTPVEHDRTVALTSHLPQLLSTALAATLASQNAGFVSQVFGPGLVDMTRLALSAPEVWASVLSTNKSYILEAIESFEATLQRLQAGIEGGNFEALFAAGAEFANRIRKPAVTN